MQNQGSRCFSSFSKIKESSSSSSLASFSLMTEEEEKFFFYYPYPYLYPYYVLRNLRSYHSYSFAIFCLSHHVFSRFFFAVVAAIYFGYGENGVKLFQYKIMSLTLAVLELG